MKKELTGKTAWVTGASRGIGRAIALAFAQHGARVIMCARTKEALFSTLEEARKISNENHIILGYDVGNVSQSDKVFRELCKEIKHLDVLVNNAGILDDALTGMITQQQISDTLGTNTEAVIRHVQYATRLMRKAHKGCIVNISSIVGKQGNIGQIVYAASKAAVIGITLSAAKELAPFGIRVNAIAPGFINTDLTKNLSSHIYQERLKSIKMGRIGEPEDVADVALFLASSLSRYVTGQVIGVDGGMQI